MPLNAAAAAAAISGHYQDAAGLDENGNPNPRPPSGDFPADFAAAYNDYATAGEVLGALNTGGDPSILEAALRGIDNTSGGVTALAAAFANFWATVAIAPGIPAHGGAAVISVSNNAAALTGLFAAAINASLTASETKPYFFNFIDNIEAIAVSEIKWTIIELLPPAIPTPFTEVIA